MKKIIDIFKEDYKEENFSVMQFVTASLFCLAFILAVGFVLWLESRWGVQ